MVMTVMCDSDNEQKLPNVQNDLPKWPILGLQELGRTVCRIERFALQFPLHTASWQIGPKALFAGKLGPRDSGSGKMGPRNYLCGRLGPGKIGTQFCHGPIYKGPDLPRPNLLGTVHPSG